MNFPQLPGDIQVAVMEAIVAAVHVKEALRMRRVNTFFAEEIVRAICKSSLVKIGLWRFITPLPWNRCHFLLFEYLRWRVKHDRPNSNPFTQTLSRTRALLVSNGYDEDKAHELVCSAAADFWGQSIAQHLDLAENNILSDPEAGLVPFLDMEINEYADLKVVAAYAGDHHLVTKLANYPSVSRHFGSVVTAAVRRGHTLIANYFLDKVSDPVELEYEQSYFDIEYGIMHSPLLAASIEGNLDSVKIFLTEKSDKGAEQRLHRALLTACEKGHVETYRYLLDKLAVLNGMSSTEILFKEIDNKTLPKYDNVAQQYLYTAINGGHYDIIHCLLCCDPKNTRLGLQDDLALMSVAEAASVGSYQVVELLLQHEFPLDIVGEDQAFPLVCALLRGNLEIVQLLLKSGQMVESLGSPAPVVICAGLGYLDTLRSLLDHGAELNAQLTDLWSFLEFMCTRGRFSLPMLEYLVESGLDVHSDEAQDDETLALGRSPLQKALKLNWLEVVTFLERHGVKPIKLVDGKFFWKQ